MRRVVVIGAGIGGLTAAALLLRAGCDVVVLEAHVYPGGCAGTFYHQGYRFDAGATLAGGFAPGGPHAQVAERLGLTWPVTPVDPAWVVHSPDYTLTQWADPAQWRAERACVFPGTESFWRTQEHLADLAWDISARPLPWPPESWREARGLAQALRLKTFGALPYLTSSVAQMPGLRASSSAFKTFLDAQLLIAAQTTSAHTHALYGSAALDLPRRGVNHVRGGLGALAHTLVDWIRAQGGQVLYRQTVESVEVRAGHVQAVRTDKGLRVEAEAVLANLTPWALNALLGAASPKRLQHEVHVRPDTWGAFTVYLGVESAFIPPTLAHHHQIIIDPSRPLGEGNSVFFSLAAAEDERRAPPGKRALTLSTHTAIAPWLEAHRRGAEMYTDRKTAYTERLLAAAEQVWPSMRRAIRLSLSGTPLTFEYYTGRSRGMVGGFAQTSLWTARGPYTGLKNLWLVGDSVFPGQSTAGVTVGAQRVAETALAYLHPTQRH